MEPPIGGVEMKWLKEMVKDTLPKPKVFDEKILAESGIAKKPTSKMQGIVQEFYFDLMEGLRSTGRVGDDQEPEPPSSDMFDKWFENEGIARYQQKYQLMQFFNTTLRALGIKEQEGYGEAEFQTALSSIAQKCIDEPEYVKKIESVINEKYPGLATPYRSAPSVTEMNDHEAVKHEQEVAQIESTITSNIERYAPQLEKIRQAAKTDFEEVAADLNRIVYYGTSAWELTLYSIMSPFAPKWVKNGILQRQTINMLLAGDISTAKSTVLWISEDIAPKCTKLDETTKASFEGVAKPGNSDEIEDGVMDKAKDGIVVIEEFVKKLADMSLFRRFMDGKTITIYKKGLPHVIDPNTAVIAGCNPDADFFIEETAFRPQLPFKEGILSRFDTVMPLTSTPIKNKMISDEMDLFGYTQEPIDLPAIRSRLETIAKGMKQINRVVITQDQQVRLKQTFQFHNERDMRSPMFKTRPLMILRDLENLSRLVNVIASVNFSKRKIETNGLLMAVDEDVDKACQLWENLIEFRIQLYRDDGNRNIKTVGDEILMYLLNQSKSFPDSKVPISIVRNHFVNDISSISDSSFYREVDALRKDRKILQTGKRDGKLELVIR